MTEKNVVGYRGKDEEFPSFKSDIMDDTGPSVPAVGGVSGVASVGAISGNASSLDSIEIWRMMSERLKKRRLEKERSEQEHSEEKFDEKRQEDIKEYVEEKKEKLNNFQQYYEEDSLILSDKKDFHNDLMDRIKQANMEVPQEKLFKPGKEEDYIEDDILRVHQIMSTDVTCVIESTTIDQVASIFNEQKIKAVPVVNYRNKQLIGIISMTDIMNYTFDDKMLSTFHTDGTFFRQDSLAIMDDPVENFMNEKVFTIDANLPVNEACQLMRDKFIHRVIITDSQEKVVGIFTAFDAVKLLAEL